MVEPSNIAISRHDSIRGGRIGMIKKMCTNNIAAFWILGMLKGLVGCASCGINSPKWKLQNISKAYRGTLILGIRPHPRIARGILQHRSLSNSSEDTAGSENPARP